MKLRDSQYLYDLLLVLDDQHQHAIPPYDGHGPVWVETSRHLLQWNELLLRLHYPEALRSL